MPGVGRGDELNEVELSRPENLLPFERGLVVFAPGLEGGNFPMPLKIDAGQRVSPVLLRGYANDNARVRIAFFAGILAHAVGHHALLRRWRLPSAGTCKAVTGVRFCSDGPACNPRLPKVHARRSLPIGSHRSRLRCSMRKRLRTVWLQRDALIPKHPESVRLHRSHGEHGVIARDGMIVVALRQ